MLNSYIKRSVGRWMFRHYSRAKQFLPNRYFAFRFPWGKIYLNPCACRAMVARIFDIYENDELNAVRTLLKPGSTFVDIGGNMGDFALLAASIVGSAGRVLYFEAEPTNSHWAQRSFELNGYKNVQVFTLALSESDGTAQLHIGDRCDYHSLLNDSGREAGTITVNTRSLDSIMTEMGTKKVDMMKIDVEGAELAVLNGALETLRNNRDIILVIELHPQMKDARPGEVLTLLHELGFALFRCAPPFDMPVQEGQNEKHLIAYRV